MRELGTLTRQLYDLKQRKQALNSELSELNKEIEQTEVDILLTMRNQDLWEAGNQEMKVFRAVTTVPKVVNLAQFHEYIYEKRAAYLLQNRPVISAFRELFEEGIQVPGVDPHTFEQVRTRSK